MKNLKKLCVTAIGTLGILGTTVFAATGIVNAPSGLVLRQEASTSSAPLATVPDKTEVNILEESEEWYKVTYNNQEGYLFKEYVNSNESVETETPETEEPIEEPTQDPQTTTETPVEGVQNVQTKSQVKVYAIPLITSTVINEIQANVEVTIEKQITNWSYISAGEIKGWVRTYGIQNPVQEQTQEQPAEQPEIPETEEPVEEPTQEPEKPETPETPNEPADNTSSSETPVTDIKGFVAVDYANVRKEASTSSEIVTTLTRDTSFEVLAETAEWYKIRYTSPDEVVYEGYMSKELVTTRNN
mgnify:CR=1 FL=1